MTDVKLYDVKRKTSVGIRPTKQFLQDMNLLMATYRMDAAGVIRDSVNSQAELVRQRISEMLNSKRSGEKDV